MFLYFPSDFSISSGFINVFSHCFPIAAHLVLGIILADNRTLNMVSSTLRFFSSFQTYSLLDSNLC